MTTLHRFGIIGSILLCGPAAIHNFPARCISPNTISDSVPSQRVAGADTSWTKLFRRNSGWFGGDGIFMVPLNSPENSAAADSTVDLIWFSDTMLGEIVNGKIKDSASMVHNSVALLHGNKPLAKNIQFYWTTDNNGKSESVFTPHTPAAKPGDYYWLGDGFRNTAHQNDIYIFGFRMHTMNPKDDWSFKQFSTDLIVLRAGSEPPFSDQRQIETPFHLEDSMGQDDGSYGAGVLVNTRESKAPSPDGYVYIYGVRGRNKELVAARVMPGDIEQFDKWRFWTGRSWTTDPKSVGKIAEHVSNELSVSPLPDGRYALVFQEDAVSPYVSMRMGATPVGPFDAPVRIFNCGENRENKNYITYNAKAHPNLSRPGELLISYNVNSYNFMKEIYANPFLYRPRFIRVKL